MLRIAIAGKGGVGKSAVTALTARAFTELGNRVLAVDLDSNPGLALSLGVSPDDDPIPSEVVEPTPGSPYGWNLAPSYDPDAVVDRCGRDAGQGITYLSFGNIGRARHDLVRFVSAIRGVAAGFERDGWVTIADLEAGPATPFEGVARFATVVLVLVEDTPASILAARRIVSILDHEGTEYLLVGSKVEGDTDARRVSEEVGTPVVLIPWDPKVCKAEKAGSLMEIGDDTPALESIKGLVKLIQERVREEVVVR